MISRQICRCESTQCTSLASNALEMLINRGYQQVKWGIVCHVSVPLNAVSAFIRDKYLPVLPIGVLGRKKMVIESG